MVGGTHHRVKDKLRLFYLLKDDRNLNQLLFSCSI